MPEVGSVCTSDVYWGMSTFSRISRLDPSTTITVDMVNARTVPYSGDIRSGNVTTSTVAGALDSIAATFSGVVVSAAVAPLSGIVTSNWASLSSITYATSAMDSHRIRAASSGDTTMKIDAGLTAFSGWEQQAVSTALSSISYFTATPTKASGWVLQSGPQIEFISAAFSGHAFDLYRHVAVSGGVTSGGTSGRVSWVAVGI